MSAPPPESWPDTELAEALAGAVLVVDRQWILRYLNAAAEDLLGLSRRRALGVALGQLVRGDLDWLRQAEAAIGCDEAFTAREIAFMPLHADQPLHVDASVSPWQASGLAVIELNPLDRHLRIAREAALQAQEQANRTLLRGLAHEIRNPLAGLRGAAELLEREFDDPHLAEYTRVIVREADRLRDLLDRMVAPAQAPARRRVNIHEITEHVLQLLTGEAPDGVALAAEYDPSIPEPAIDRDQIIQALLNLGRNALQALGEEGRVVLRTRALRRFTIGSTPHRLVVAVEMVDTGPGVPAELREHLFQPLVSGRADGSGLGLTIAQTLARRHGGLIECDSTPGGTTFRMLLPLEAGDD